MVLRCELTSMDDGAVIPAWQAVERRQRALAASYHLISQPNHAALAGALAARFVAPQFPALDPLLVMAIAEHDCGWALFDSEADPAVAPPVDERGKPLSFIDIVPADFVRAWTASIDRAEEICPAGGIMVSTHFRRLCRHRLNAAADHAADKAVLEQFDDREARRAARLLPAAKITPAQVAALTDTLQFCDLLSLYLCCGASEEVTFPQMIAGAGAPQGVRGRYEGGALHLQPSPFQRDALSDPNSGGISVAVSATRWDASSRHTKVDALAFILW